MTADRVSGALHPDLLASDAHVFVDDVAAPVLDSEDEVHLLRALRLRPGAMVTVSDGRGRWRRCRLGAGGLLEPDGHQIDDPRRAPPVVIAAAIPKGDRLDWMVQKLTEIGADRIVLMRTDRGVVSWDRAREASALARLARIVRQAAMQSRRTWLVELPSVRTAFELAAEPGAALAVPGSMDRPLPSSTVLVGPEGGWTQREIEASANHVGLGGTVLRVETAALVACTLLVHARASGPIDLSQENHSW